MLSALAVLLFFAAAFGIVQKAEPKDSPYTYAEYLFQKNVVNEIEITIAEADWKDILENPLAEEYHRADVTINGETMKNVAIRTKGNTSLTSVANSDSDRYSFKVDFDYYEDAGNYHGLKKLCLNNSYADNGGLREYVGYEIMREMGIPVPQCGYSHITVNGEEWGLYLAVEAIDEVFLQTRFADAAGDLYKPEGMGGTGANLAYQGDNIAEYTGLHLKTNPETSDGSEILALMKALESGEGLEEVLDVEEALKYIAANVAISNFDSYLGGTTHNYYLYEENGVFSVLPWDLNLAFGGFGGGKVDIDSPASGGMGGFGGRGNREKNAEQTEEAGEKPDMGNFPAMGEMPDMGNFPAVGEMPDMGGMPFGGGMGGKPLVDTLLANDTYRMQYEGYLREIAETYLTEAYMGTLVTQIHDLIAPYIKKDATAFYTYEEFEQVCSVDAQDPYSLVYYAVNMAADIQNQLAGGEPSFDVSTLKGGGMGFGREGGFGGFGGRREQNAEGEVQTEERPAMGNMPKMEEKPAMDNMPTMGEKPDMDNMPTMGEKPAMGNMPAMGEKPAMEDRTSKKGGLPDGMHAPPEGLPFHGQKQPEPMEYIPQMAVCGGVFAAGFLFVIFYKRKKKL